MTTHAFICTRDNKKSSTTEQLLSYLDKCSVKVHLLVDKASIFNAYSEELRYIEDKNDIVIMCHDDIEILTDPMVFKNEIAVALSDEKCGFVGVAGTKKLTEDSIWWNREVWQNGGHRGCVFHGKSRDDMTATPYGPPGKVVVLDGLFLAATVNTLRQVQLEKPDTFPGGWDFYDLYYTMIAYESLGKYNKVLPILLRHESVGQLAGRESWHKNREQFIKLFNLPISCP